MVAWLCFQSRGIREEALANGLFRQHAYSITKLAKVRIWVLRESGNLILVVCVAVPVPV